MNRYIGGKDKNKKKDGFILFFSDYKKVKQITTKMEFHIYEILTKIYILVNTNSPKIFKL